MRFRLLPSQVFVAAYVAVLVLSGIVAAASAGTGVRRSVAASEQQELRQQQWRRRSSAADGEQRRQHGGNSRGTDFVGCNDPCNGGDVNYELVASVQTIPMGFGNYTYRGRTFARPDPKTGEVPRGPRGYMGPTLRVKRGESMWIKLRNEMGTEGSPDKTPPAGEDDIVAPREVQPSDYWRMVQKPGERIKYTYYKKPVASPELMDVDYYNVPGEFDYTNIHLHGLDVEVHMFDPVGTHDPDAPHVAVGPGECYCYRFNVPEDHPEGMYWYHPHLHGSSAVQLWGGMMGLIYVEGGEFENELASYNVRDTREFVLWDPAFQDVSGSKPGAAHNIEVDEFLMGQTTLSKIHPFLVNGEITPNFPNVGVNEVLHLRALCGTIENENTFIVYKEGADYLRPNSWETESIPFYQVASDGVAYERPRKRHVIVMAGGQREELLLKFDEPGRYVISQQGIQGMQFFDMYGHPHDQLLATIDVVDKGEDTVLPTVPIEDMVFTPGYKEEETIESHQITKTESIVFSMGADRNIAPFPQYYINGKAFDPKAMDFHANPGEAVEYVLINANHNVHPFHIHVNRFQVKEMGSELSTDKYPVLKEVMNFDPDVWRDTVVVPPNGRARIWVQYKNYTGKTVFHCHFLAHEDTGMMATLFIGPPDVFFKWTDHVPLIAGLGAGFVLGMAFLYLAYVIFWQSEKDETLKEYYYSVVKMNELKSKTVD